MNLFIQKILGIRSDFEGIFFNNEYQALAGRNKRTILALLTILFFTFLALGFAVGSINNLSKKMDNPFTNWVNLNIFSNYVSEKSGEIIQRYSDPEIQEQFNIGRSNGFSRYSLDFYHKGFSPFRHNPDTLLRHFWGRTIEPDEPLFGRILDPSSNNLVWLSDELYDEDGEPIWDGCRIIVTTKLLSSLGYTDPAQVKYLGVSEERRVVGNSDLTVGVWLPMKVVAVVEELPDVDFIGSPQLYNILKLSVDIDRCRSRLLLENQEGDSQFLLLTEDEAGASELAAVANEYFVGKRPGVDIEFEFPSEGRNWAGCRFSFLPTDAPSLHTLREFIEFASEKVAVAEFSTINCGLDDCGTVDSKNLLYLAFFFENLNDIRIFRDDMDREFGIQLDMRQIESKENFALVSSLTFAISTILLAFGILSIVLFVNNLLRTHLFEVRSNLGTFTAFGLSNRFLIYAYLKIIFSFLALSILVAFLMSLAVDIVEGWWMQGESRFDIINAWILAAIAGLMLVSLFLSFFTINRILGDTPGNLIYER